MVDPLLLKVFAYAYGPVVILAVMAFFWARHSNSPRLASVLRKSALFCTLWLGALSVILILATETCKTILNYTYSDCPLVPDAIGAVIFNTVVTSYLIAAMYLAVLALAGAIVEFKATRNRTSPPSRNPLQG